MDESVREEKGFVAYEYKTIHVYQAFAQLYRDCFKNLGWITVEHQENNIGVKPVMKPGYIILQFKRDRKIRGIAKIDELQQECEHALASIERLEKTKTSRSTMSAIIIGLAGTCFVAGSVFSYDAGLILLCVILGMIGFAGWGAAYPSYTKVNSKVTSQVTPIIDEQYERLYHACEHANRLLT